MPPTIARPKHFPVRLGHCSFNAIPVQPHRQSCHRMNSTSVEAISRTNRTITHAQAQDLATDSGPSVPEILQSKGRRVRVNYIRRDNQYNVSLLHIDWWCNMRYLALMIDSCVAGLGPAHMGGRQTGD